MASEIPQQMRAVIKKTETEGYTLETIDVPEPTGDEVLIRVDCVAICGSDIALYKWNDVAKVIATVPFIPGHECAGTVVQCGPEASLQVGQKVGVENHFYCGQCYQCQHDQESICQNMGQYGHGKKTMHGGFSQYSIVSSKYCFPMEHDLTAEQIVLLEPLGVAHNAMESLEVSAQQVLVIGCGPVGLLGIAVAKALGATRIYAADIDESRLQLAGTMGADLLVNAKESDLKEVIMRETGGDGVGRICEMSGAPDMVNSMFAMLRKGGHVVMVGLPKAPLHVDNVLQDIVFKSLSLRTVHGRRIYHTWEECARLVAEQRVDVLPVVSHRLPMTRFQDAFDALLGGQACKIVLDPQM